MHNFFYVFQPIVRIVAFQLDNNQSFHSNSEAFELWKMHYCKAIEITKP